MVCSDDKVLLYNTSLSIRGLSAVEIMLGHIGIATGLFILYPNRKAGILFVGIFFLLSGYGLSKSLNENKEYLKHFLIRRMSSILIPAYLVYLLSGIIDLFRLKQFPFLIIVQYVLCAEFFSRTNWYVFEILIFYIVFYLSCRFLRGGGENSSDCDNGGRMHICCGGILLSH